MQEGTNSPQIFFLPMNIMGGYVNMHEQKFTEAPLGNLKEYLLTENFERR